MRSHALKRVATVAPAARVARSRRHRVRTMSTLCIIATVATVAGEASADVVYLADGSRIVGRIVHSHEQVCVVETAFAGTLKIDQKLIKAISTDEAVVVEFESGDRLVGRVEHDEGAGTTTIHSAVGDVPVADAEVRMIWRDGEESPADAAEKVKMEEAIAAAQPKHSLKIEFGGRATEGNTDTMTASGRLDFQLATPKDLFKAFLSADYADTDDKRSRNEQRGGVSYEQKLTERMFWYMRFEAEHDEFENLDLRTTAAAGLGYYWIQRPEHELKTRTGLGYRHETYEDDTSRDEAVGDFGLDYRLDIAPAVQFVHATTWTPALEDFGDYRLELDTSLQFPLQVSDKLKLKVGMRNEYNSRPVDDREQLDNTYYMNFVLSLSD